VLYKFLLSFILLSGGQDLLAQEPAKQEKVVLKQKADSLLQAVALKAENPEINCSANAVQVKEQPRIRLGGVSSISSRDPLVVLDGLPVKYSEIAKINPKKIISINVLKDAKAFAIYGSEGANGVILIETNYSKKERKKLFAVN
jgi:TonB-dependent SusC/RagA subfamily outer membrane receptor